MGVTRKSYQPAVTISQQVGTTGNITASITPLSQREYFNIGCKFNL
jgi:hypothetical protein